MNTRARMLDRAASQATARSAPPPTPPRIRPPWPPSTVAETAPSPPTSLGGPVPVPRTSTENFFTQQTSRLHQFIPFRHYRRCDRHPQSLLELAIRANVHIRDRRPINPQRTGNSGHAPGAAEARRIHLLGFGSFHYNQ